jgi:hypothetical protein
MNPGASDSFADTNQPVTNDFAVPSAMAYFLSSIMVQTIAANTPMQKLTPTAAT